MLTVDNGQLYRNGRPFKHVGVNAYDLFHRYDQSFDAQPFFREGFELMSDYGIKVARCIIGGPCRHHFNTFFNAQSTYLSKLLAFLNAAADNDVEVLMTFAARWAGLSDRNNERMSAWTDPGSQCRQQFVTFVSAIVTQFKDHRAVGGYELGNEWNTFLDRRVMDGDAGNTSLPSATECAGQNLAPYSAPNDSLTFERYAATLDAFVTTITGIDTSGRLISTGNAMGYVNSARGLYEWMPRALRENPTTVNSLCIHPYADPSLSPGSFWEADADGMVGFMRGAAEVARQRGQILLLGEFGVKDGYTAQGKTEEQIFDTALEAAVQAPLSLVWTVADPTRTSMDPKSSIWRGYRDYQLRKIKAANEQFGIQ